jgi:hypothetical protein
MAKLVGVAMIVIGATWWMLSAGASGQSIGPASRSSSRPASEPSTSPASGPPAIASQPSKLTEAERKGELTRELAARILNEYLAKPSVAEIGFREGGLDSAVTDGLVKKNSWKPGQFPGPRYAFTDKGLKAASGVTLKCGNFGGLSDDTPPALLLKDPIGETVDKVTGITVEDPKPTVEFTTSYTIPAEMMPFRKYVFTGAKRAVVFRKYDDGWRVHN